MKYISFFGVFLLILIFQSCSSSKVNNSSSRFWVSGFKVEGQGGVGKTQNYLINRNSNYEDGTWEYIYIPIEGFNFEEGVLKQIEVEQVTLNPSQVPADTSSIKYILKKELQKAPDIRSFINKSWIVVEINREPLDIKIEPPTLDITLNTFQTSGNDGCNKYVGQLQKLTTTEISFSQMASTKLACIKEDKSYEYYKAIQATQYYKVSEKSLELLGEDGETLIKFIPKSQIMQ